MSAPIYCLSMLYLLVFTLYLAHCQEVEPADAGCRAKYDIVSVEPTLRRPLLFGGVYNSCKSGCQQRLNDTWSQMCNPYDIPKTGVTNKCQLFQTPEMIDALRQIEGPALLNFSPCELHRYLQGRTLWLVGDSIMRYMYYALRCFMLDFWDHSLGECAVSPDIEVQKKIFQAADTDLTSVMGHHAVTDTPGCVHLLEGGRLCWVNSVRGEEFAGTSRPGDPSLLRVLQSVAHSDDIFLINFGRWHFNNCHGLQIATYTRSLQQVAKLYQETRQEFPNLIFRVTSHDHSPCPNKKTNIGYVPPPQPPHGGTTGNSSRSHHSNNGSAVLDSSGGYSTAAADRAAASGSDAYNSTVASDTAAASSGLVEYETQDSAEYKTQDGLQPASQLDVLLSPSAAEVIAATGMVVGRVPDTRNAAGAAVDAAATTSAEPAAGALDTSAHDTAAEHVATDGTTGSLSPDDSTLGKMGATDGSYQPEYTQQQPAAASAVASDTAGAAAMANDKKARWGDVCLPASKGNYSLGIGRMISKEAEAILGSAGVPLIDNYNVTRGLWRGHIFVDHLGWDCNHWCSPGVPEWEVYTMFKAFQKYNIKPLTATAVKPRKCVPVVIQSPPPEDWVRRGKQDSLWAMAGLSIDI